MGGSSKEVGTWSIAAGASLSHTDSYTGDAGYNELPQSAKLWGQSAASDGISTASTLLMDWKSIAGFFALSKGDKIGETVGSAISKIGDLTEAQGIAYEHHQVELRLHTDCQLHVGFQYIQRP